MMKHDISNGMIRYLIMVYKSLLVLRKNRLINYHKRYFLHFFFIYDDSGGKINLTWLRHTLTRISLILCQSVIKNDILAQYEYTLTKNQPIYCQGIQRGRIEVIAEACPPPGHWARPLKKVLTIYVSENRIYE